MPEAHQGKKKRSAIKKKRWERKKPIQNIIYRKK